MEKAIPFTRMFPPAVVHCNWLTHCWLIVEWMRNGKSNRSRNFILSEKSSQSVKKSLFVQVSNDHGINRWALDSSTGKSRKITNGFELCMRKRQESKEVEEVKWIKRKLRLFYTICLSIWHTSFPLCPLFLSLPLSLIERMDVPVSSLIHYSDPSELFSLFPHWDKHGHETTIGNWIPSHFGSLVDWFSDWRKRQEAVDPILDPCRYWFICTNWERSRKRSTSQKIFDLCFIHGWSIGWNTDIICTIDIEIQTGWIIE